MSFFFSCFIVLHMNYPFGVWQLPADKRLQAQSTGPVHCDSEWKAGGACGAAGWEHSQCLGPRPHQEWLDLWSLWSGYHATVCVCVHFFQLLPQPNAKELSPLDKPLAAFSFPKQRRIIVLWYHIEWPPPDTMRAYAHARVCAVASPENSVFVWHFSLVPWISSPAFHWWKVKGAWGKGRGNNVIWLPD